MGAPGWAVVETVNNAANSRERRVRIARVYCNSAGVISMQGKKGSDRSGPNGPNHCVREVRMIIVMRLVVWRTF